MSGIARRRWWIRRIGRRPPLARQHDWTDCGPAALLSVLRFWGGDASLAAVRDLAGTDSAGTTLLGLKRAAGAIGLEPIGVRTDLGKLETGGGLPCVAHAMLPDGRSHYLVVYEVGASRVTVGDPSMGRKRLARSDFEVLWTSRAALLLWPGPSLRRTPPPPWWNWVASYFRPDSAWLIQTLFLGAVGTVLGLATAVGIQFLIDRFIPGRDVAMILWTGVILFALLVGRILLAHVRHRMLLRLHRDVAVKMNEDLLEHLFRLPLRFFETRATGEITARLSDAVRIQRALLDVVGTLVIDGLIMIGSVAFLVYLAPPIAVIAFATVPLYALLLARASAPLKEKEKHAMAGRSTVESSWIDGLSGIGEILGYGAARRFTRSNLSLFRAFQDDIEQLGRARADLKLLAELVGGCLVLMTLVWGALYVVQGALLMGELVAGYSILAAMLPSAERLAGAAVSVQEASVASERLRDILLAETDAADGPDARVVPMVRELRLSDGAIEWPPGTRRLDRLEIGVRMGEMTALSGPNGSGKTTLLRALARLVPLASGELYLNEAPGAEFSLSDWRRRVAICRGNPRIFRGTLGHNVRLGRADSGRSGAFRQLGAAGLHHFLRRFPRGWDTLLGEGGRRLSDGEGLVVSFLRALWGVPEVLLADEVLSAADPEVSALILGGLEAYAREHAVLVVTHDSAVLERAGRAYAVRGGTLVA